MKTKPMAHQARGLDWSDGRWFYGLFWEQGTGKTWSIMADAERAFGRGRINGLLVVAPKGVHTNWTRRELPTHLSAPYKAAAYRSGSVRALKACQSLSVEAGDKLRVMTINIDALNFKEGFTASANFLRNHQAMMVIDESHRIKSPNAGVTKAAMRLSNMAFAKRIASGTPLTNAPPDLYSQFEFLKPGLLGTDSYRAFVAKFAELMPDDTGIMRHIVKRMKEKNAWAAKQAEKGLLKTPQIVRKDRDGNPRWRNLDILRDLLTPHTMRVLKKDCLDLPEKIHQTRYFNLSPMQQRVYEKLKTEYIIEFGDNLLAVEALSARIKLQQVTAGFVLIEGEPHYIEEKNPRLELLEEVIQDQQGQVIIWAHFREEIAAIGRLMDKLGIPSCQYHGDVSDKNREEAVDGFQAGLYDVFIGQPRAGGVGLTLTAASSVIYYSNDFNYGTRAQSEDRSHRIGSEGLIHRIEDLDVHGILYIDLVAEDTIDENIASALQFKENTAAIVLGDR